MKITLTQPEIEQAVREFVGKGVSLNNASAMSVEFSMGRGENGLTAAIDVPYMGVASLPFIAPPPGPTPRTFTEVGNGEQTDAGASAATESVTVASESAAAPGKSLFGTTSSS